MKALIFAAGLGTRLKPLTDDRPKAMVEVAGKPMLQHVIERVAAAGFHDITINIHHFGQTIIDFLESNHHFGLNIHISDERGQLLDTSIIKYIFMCQLFKCKCGSFYNKKVCFYRSK